MSKGRTVPRKHSDKEYALYKGDDLITMGTIKEIAEELGIHQYSVAFYDTPTYKKRTSENARRLVCLD